ncbi:MAG TPA: DUF5107 domain-containing protein [Fimbriimonas sp.]|nr:DUF5107 domain-containing protein [Fimbriimonas sp.]
MPSAARIAVFDADFPIAEALEIDPASSGYPFPPLRLTSHVTHGQWESVALENDFLSLTAVPALGGRIVAIHDKRAGRDVFNPHLLTLREGGRRGVESLFGIQLITDGQERLNSMGPVDFSFSADEESSSTLWVAESFTWPLSFHLRIDLPSDRAEINLEARIFNRSSEAAHYNGGLLCSVPIESVCEIGKGWLCWEEIGMAMQSEELRYSSTANGSVVSTRFERLREMSPHQLDTWSAVLTPISGLSNRPYFGGGLAAAFSEDRIEVQASRPFERHKLLLLTRGGSTLEAMANLSPDKPVVLSLGENERDPAAIALLSSAREQVFRASPVGGLVPLSEAAFVEPEVLSEAPRLSATRAKLLVAAFRMQDRAWAHYLLGVQALQAKEFSEADWQFEQSLLFNGEDHLAWWMKAVAKRHLGEVEDLQELLNAHYLAPLEPALRAEALLGQSPQEGFGGSPLLEPLVSIPENLIEVACRMVEARLFEDASRWIDESLRHIDLPMLRYLLAFSLLAGSRMDIEAAQQVRAVKQLAPPFPYRPVEREALGELSSRFPGDEVLRRYAALAATSRNDST